MALLASATTICSWRTSHVAHDCIVGNNALLPTLLDWRGMLNCRLGDSFCIQACISSAKWAHVHFGNNAAATRDVPPYVIAVGSPAEPHSVNTEGLKRRGFTPEQVRNIRDAYRILYRSQLKLEEVIAQFTQLAKTQPEIQLFVDFMPRSQRSLIR